MFLKIQKALGVCNWILCSKCNSESEFESEVVNSANLHGIYWYYDQTRPYKIMTRVKIQNNGQGHWDFFYMHACTHGSTHTHTYTYIHTYIHTYIFVVVNFDDLAQASDIQIERRQVVFLCWRLDLNPGPQTPNRQQTECSLSNRLSYRGSS